jgi:uncharacterized SAM-binding protein YcdF (DUF218 family)
MNSPWALRLVACLAVVTASCSLYLRHRARPPARSQTRMIVVLGGGGQRGETPDTLPPWTIRRLDRAARLYNEYRAADSRESESVFIACLSAGTPHRPNYISAKGWPILESTSAAQYLAQKHAIPYSALLRETTSLDTIGNAFFLRTAFTDPMRVRKLHIVTSDFHMSRTRAVFRWVFQIDTAFCEGYELTFESVSEEGIDPEIVASRTQREADSLRAFAAGTQVSLPSDDAAFMLKLSTWLHTVHGAYACSPGMIPTVDANRELGSALSSY